MGYRLQVKIMKKMRNIMTIVMLVALVALPTKAQTFGGNDPQYSAVPTTAFHSTSAMPMSGSTYASQPVINADGMATYEGAGRPGGGPRKIDAIEIPDELDEQPLGDAVLPLMLMALLFGAITALKRKRIVS